MQKLSFVLASVVLCGCTTSLSVYKPTDSVDAIPKGAGYRLPATQLDITASFRITKCSIVQNGTPDAAWKFESELTGAQITSASLSDPQESYLIDYSKLNSAMKITIANFEWYPSGMIRTMNADMDDRTAQVSASLASAAINIAKAAYAPLGITGTGEAGDTPAECPDSLKKSIADFNGLRDKIVAAQKSDAALKPKLDELAEAKKALTAAQAALTASPSDKKLKTAADNAKKEFEQLNKKYGKEKLGTPELIEQRTALTRRLTATVHAKWIPRRSEQSGPICQKFITPLSVFLNSFIDDSVTSAEVNKFHEAKAKLESFSLWVCLTNVDGTNFQAETKPAPAPADSAIKTTGLVYRWPAPANVAIYGIKKDGSRDEAIKYAVDSEDAILFAQLGQKSQLPLENGPFDKNNLKVAFVENGSPSKLDFTAQSSAETASAAVKDLTAQYATLRDLKAKAEKAKADASDAATKAAKDAEIADLDYQITLVGKQQALDLARLGGKDDVQQKIDAESKAAEMLDKQIATEQKRQAYDKLLKERTQ